MAAGSAAKRTAERTEAAVIEEKEAPAEEGAVAPSQAVKQEENAKKSESPLQANANDPARRTGFTPHKALYDIKLVGKKSSSQVVNIAGQMMYDWEGGCEGWSSNHRFDVLYEYADSAPMRITSDFSTYELFDGQSLQFITQRKREGELFEELRGSASILPGEAGKAVLRVPEGMSFDLPAGTLFPMQHTMAVLKAIKQGEKFFKATIFDGSDQDGPVEVNAFIGAEVQYAASEIDKGEIAASEIAEGEKKNDSVDEALLKARAWNVRLAFFPLNDNEASADYEMSLVFHENGVISDMVVEYGDFSVAQTLSALDQGDPAGVACP